MARRLFFGAALPLELFDDCAADPFEEVAFFTLRLTFFFFLAVGKPEYSFTYRARELTSPAADYAPSGCWKGLPIIPILHREPVVKPVYYSANFPLSVQTADKC